MKKIKILPKNIVEKIAAGEVIERPFSVVKELIDNSIDARAKNIKIDLKRGGLEEIKVIDDGMGMSKVDLKNCFLTHATSKIENEADLFCVKSLGFRGEALSSIASVSDLSIKSKTYLDKTGTLIMILDKKVQKVSPCAMPRGTEIKVNSIFENIPARKKFLKSPQTEFSSILQLVNRMALAFPKIGFKLTNNQKLIYNLAKNQTIKQRMRYLLKDKIYQKLFPIKLKNDLIELTGFIGSPQIALNSRQKQFLFINNRIIRDFKISQAVKKAFSSLISNKSHPVFLLSFQTPPNLIDINIHPRKEEVKFLHEQEILQTISEAVKKNLYKNNLAYGFDPEIHQKFNSYDNLDQAYLDKLREFTAIFDIKDKSKKNDYFQFQNKYLILKNQESLIIIDQHNAHERIIYDNLKNFILKKTDQNKQPITKLKDPILIELSKEESDLLLKHLALFEKIGFSLELFGKNSFKIESFPAIFKKELILEMITQILSLIKEKKAKLKLTDLFESALKFLACKNAIKAGESLSLKEQKNLINQFKHIKNKFTCPHGRPIIIEITTNELDKMFKRI
jgi:DNA mismatch repair protein MutL